MRQNCACFRVPRDTCERKECPQDLKNVREIRARVNLKCDLQVRAQSLATLALEQACVVYRPDTEHVTLTAVSTNS